MTTATKTPLDSYGPSASKYAVISRLALEERRVHCECRNYNTPCTHCADEASNKAWAQLTPEERVHEQELQRNVDPIPESQRFW